MTAVLDIRSTPAALPAAWAGRILSGVIGGFLGLDGLTRIVWGQALVAPSETAPTLEPSLQLMIGLPLLIGAGLGLFRTTRLAGAGLLLICLACLLAVELLADVRSPGHLLFWAYVAALTTTGAVLRRLR